VLRSEQGGITGEILLLLSVIRLKVNLITFSKYLQWGYLVDSAEVREGSLILDKFVTRNRRWRLKLKELKMKVRFFCF